jgi:MbtH protein
MSDNVFDVADGRFLVLRNDVGQYSLWPATIDVPAGWHVRLPADTRTACLDFIERNWTDLRPTGTSDRPRDVPTKLGACCTR